VAKNVKISTLKLNLVQNIYIKTQLKPLNNYNKPYAETACLGKNWLSEE
jgi:hypothetical protein